MTMPTALDALLEDRPADERAEILRELLEQHADPKDPLYDLLRLFKLTLQTNSQTIALTEQIPLQLQGLLTEIDEKFDHRLGQWRGLPPEIAQSVKDVVTEALPDVLAQAKAAGAKEVIEAREREIAVAKDDMRTAVTQALTTVAVRAKAAAGDPAVAAAAARRSSVLQTLVILCLGALAGYGWGQSHAQYPPPIQRLITAGEQYQNVYAHMPAAMKEWVKRYQAAR